MDKQQAKQRLPLFVPPPTTTTSAFPSYLVRLSSFLSLRHLFSLYHGSYIYCILRPWHRSSYHRVPPLFRFFFCWRVCFQLSPPVVPILSRNWRGVNFFTSTYRRRMMSQKNIRLNSLNPLFLSFFSFRLVCRV